MVPSETGPDTYLMLDVLGRLGRVWRETAEADADHETLICDLLDDQYSRPTRIDAFNNRNPKRPDAFGPLPICPALPKRRSAAEISSRRMGTD
jgi:hypothetical protein